jgi:phage terminase small subunit
MKNDEIRQRIAVLQDERKRRAEVAADRVLVELARIAFYDARALYRPDGTLKDPSEWDESTAAVVAGVEVDEEVTTSADGTRTVARTKKVRRADKVRALELLARHLTLLNDSITVKTPPRSGVDVSKIPEDARRVLLTALRTAAGRPSGN